jgi:hypothetical protein
MNASYLVADAAKISPELSTSRAAAALRVVGIHHSCCREILRLKTDNEHLHDELGRLRAEHEDLRKSAELWIRLYETQLELTLKRSGVTALCRS